MNEELKKLLGDLNTNIQQMNRGEAVKQASAPTGETVVEKISADDMREKSINPLRKNFEDLAKADRGFSVLAAEKHLDNPLEILRAKGELGYRVPNAQIGGMIATLLQKGARAEGTPIGEWISKSGQQSAIETNLERALSKGSFGDLGNSISKALESGGGSGGPLIRTDIEPLLREAYLRQFPALDVIGTEPANGLVHSYNVKTATGDAVTVAELGDVTSANADSTFVRKANSNIAVIVSRRGISLKLQYASAQSGMNFGLSGPNNTEIISGLQSISRKNQALLLQGNYSTASKTLDDEEGLTDANGYDGLRTLLKSGGTSINKASNEKLYDKIDQAVGQIMNAGGDVSSIIGMMSVGAKRLLNTELQQYMMRLNNDNSPTNLNISGTGLMTVAETQSRMMAVPASAQKDGVGYYTYSAAATEDAFVCDPNGMSLAYLGSPNPVILELPVGFNNTLSNVYIIFLMNGLVLFIDGFHRKVRLAKQTV